MNLATFMTAPSRIVKKLITRNCSVSVRKIAREIGVNRESVRLIAKNEPNLRSYKLQKVHLLTDDNKRVRLQRCRQLKRRAAGQKWERILFTDEKIFTIQQAHNHQNDGSWSAEAPGTSAIIERRQCNMFGGVRMLEPKNLKAMVKHGVGHIMVWACMATSGVGNLVSIDGAMDAMVSLTI
ncbi:uncharacterized protein [Drosophila bipectinata]|uniref:uncharacterized protein n=1 Tax=Drosophila bipectinata TaxID=42026 RepID=UPI0038B24BFC